MKEEKKIKIWIPSKEKEKCEHKWGELQKEKYDVWSVDDNAVKFYYQRCEKCGEIRIVAA